MKAKIFLTIVSAVLAVFIQLCFKIEIEKRFIAVLLTVLSLFFGFYVTSFAVYANSNYLAQLYKVTDKNAPSRTLLDTLLRELRGVVRFLYASIIYLIMMYILLLAKSVYVPYFTIALWWFLLMNAVFTYRMIDRFVYVVRKTAANNAKE